MLPESPPGSPESPMLPESPGAPQESPMLPDSPEEPTGRTARKGRGPRADERMRALAERGVPPNIVVANRVDIKHMTNAVHRSSGTVRELEEARDPRTRRGSGVRTSDSMYDSVVESLRRARRESAYSTDITIPSTVSMGAVLRRARERARAGRPRARHRAGRAERSVLPREPDARRGRGVHAPARLRAERGGAGRRHGTLGRLDGERARPIPFHALLLSRRVELNIRQYDISKILRFVSNLVSPSQDAVALDGPEQRVLLHMLHDDTKAKDDTTAPKEDADAQAKAAAERDRMMKIEFSEESMRPKVPGLEGR